MTPGQHSYFVWQEQSQLFMPKSLKFFFSTFIYFWDRERQEDERARGRERGRHRIGNRLQALSHQPRARRGARTHGPRDRDLAEVGRLTDWATQAPPYSSILMCFGKTQVVAHHSENMLTFKKESPRGKKKRINSGTCPGEIKTNIHARTSVQMSLRPKQSQIDKK